MAPTAESFIDAFLLFRQAMQARGLSLLAVSDVAQAMLFQSFLAQQQRQVELQAEPEVRHR